ncbi:hypothetical protein [Algoriphagus sp.]|uniref:hypothetical protein n=1 Tax=Algoriphagus sp. TaxID=1872435 RepID=UPI0032978284
MPITMRYEMPKGIFIELGPQVSFRLNASHTVEAELSDGEVRPGGRYAGSGTEI